MVFCGEPTVSFIAEQLYFLWRQAVADIIGVTASHALRNNSRCTWRRSTGLQNVSHAAIRRALSLLRLCGSVGLDHRVGHAMLFEVD
jgi:hypothetical protein